MMFAFLITFIFALVVWLVFFKFKWLKFTKAWGVLVLFFAAHLFLTFIVGLRFITPYSTNLKVVQHTTQLIPRLPEPTLVTAVLVAPDVPVKKGQPLSNSTVVRMITRSGNWKRKSRLPRRACCLRNIRSSS